MGRRRAVTRMGQGLAIRWQGRCPPLAAFAPPLLS